MEEKDFEERKKRKREEKWEGGGANLDPMMEGVT